MQPHMKPPVAPPNTSKLVGHGFGQGADDNPPRQLPPLPANIGFDQSGSPTPAADQNRSWLARNRNTGSARIPVHETSGIVAAAKALHRTGNGGAAPFELQHTMTPDEAEEADSRTRAGSAKLPNAPQRK